MGSPDLARMNEARAQRAERTITALLATIEGEARRYASHYAEATDGRNTFVMFADFVAERALASAIETRRAETLGSVEDESAGPQDDAQTPEQPA